MELPFCKFRRLIRVGPMTTKQRHDRITDFPWPFAGYFALHEVHSLRIGLSAPERPKVNQSVGMPKAFNHDMRHAVRTANEQRCSYGEQIRQE